MRLWHRNFRRCVPLLKRERQRENEKYRVRE